MAALLFRRPNTKLMVWVGDDPPLADGKTRLRAQRR
jgi:hypothetical protein